MNDTGPTQELSAIDREAESWYERLDDPDLQDRVWKDFLKWQTSPANQEAFDATATRRELMLLAQQRASADFSPLFPRSPATTLALVAMVVGIHIAFIVAVLNIDVQPNPRVFFTTAEAAGWLLDDGSLLRAEPYTWVEVELDSERRSMRLRHGSAFFRVAPMAGRAFVVRTEPADVEARGTAFGVSIIGQAAKVTVMEGTVAVSPGAAKDTSAAVRFEPFNLQANEQARVWPARVERMASADVVKSLMWATTIQFDNRPAIEAAAQFARLSGIELEIDATEPASVAPVTGIFQLDDPVAFARAVANETQAAVHVFFRPELPHVVVQPAPHKQ
jgi:transmembrane sensor